MEKDEVLEKWKSTAFLAEEGLRSRSWLIDIIAVIDKIPAQEFALSEVYAFKSELKGMHPENKNVRPKIRQKLQVLRDNGYIAFSGNGKYRKLK